MLIKSYKMPNERKQPEMKPIKTSLLQIIIVCILFLNIQCFNFKQLARSSVSKVINQRTSYTFVFDRSVNNSGISMPWNSQAVASTGNISVQFPMDFTLTGSQTCDKIDIVSATQSYSPTTYQCHIDGNKLVFAGSLTGLSDLFIKSVTVTYSNILNPSPAIKTRQFVGYIGVDVAVSMGSSWIQLTAAIFSQCALTFGNGGYVNTTSPAIFDLTTLNQLNSSSMIRVTFPSSKIWLNDISQSILPINTGSMSCSSVSFVQSGIICTGNYVAFTVQASSIFTSTVLSGQKLSFQINNFISPPTLQDIDSIKITSLTSGFEVDTCTIKVTGLKPKQLRTLTIQPINGQMKVNQKVGIAINMTFSDTVNELDSFRVTFPGDIVVEFGSVSTSGTSEGVSSLMGQVLGVNMNTNFQVTYWEDHFFVINFYTMTAPPSVKESEPITVQVLRNGFQKMIGSTTVKATQSTLSGTVNPTTTLVGTKTFYTINIQLNDKLSPTGWIQLTFPSTIILPSSITSISASGTGIKPSPTVTVDTLTNKITITSLSSGSMIPAQTLTITLGQIQNPGTTKSTAGFSMTSYYQTGNEYLVATGTMLGFKPTAGILKSSDILVSKSSDIVLDGPIQYEIKFVTTYDIPQNGVIKIQIPDDIKLDLASLSSYCFQKVNSLSKISATCTASLNSISKKYELTVTSIALTSSLVAPSTISIFLENICTNPDTTRNILGFSINIFSQDNDLIQGASTGISVRANTPAQCLNVAVSRGSKKNSDLTNYQISLKQPSTLQPGSHLIVTLPTKLTLSSNTACLDLNSNILTCTIIDNIVTVTLPSTSTAPMTTFGIILTNILNTPSYEPLNQAFTLLTKTPDNINKYCQSSSPVLLENTIPSDFISITASHTPRIYNQITSLIVDFKPSARVVPAYVMVYLAAELKVQTLGCSFQSVTAGACTSPTPTSIKLTGTFSANPQQFTITGIRAPKFKQTPSQFSSIASFTSFDFKIDQAINIVEFKVQCQLPCKTCTSDILATQCLSCYQDVTISTQTYYLPSQKKCFSVCPDGFYQDTQTLECQLCNPLCKTCQISSTNCQTCYSDATAKYLNKTSSTVGTCLANCPTLYYPNALGQCVLCQSPCQDCTSKLVCLNCTTGFFMHNKECIPQCPTGTTITNTVARTCDKCSEVCATCSGTVNNCVTCNPGAANYSNTCTTTCPPPLVINAGQCASCDPICKECSIRATNCTKCDPSSTKKYLLDFTCKEDCPGTHYKNLINGVCDLCEDLKIGCKYCTSPTTCTICEQGLVFLNGKCYGTTPLGYFNSSGIALPCAGDCATCVDFANKCTSCKTLNLDTGNVCVMPCLSPTKVPQNKICVSCSANCLTCSNIKTNCTSCLPGLDPPLFLNNFYCTDTCPQFTYKNNTTLTCAACKEPCLKCTAQNQCISCVNGKFLSGTSCSGQCDDGFVGINKVCQPCLENCQTCEVTQTRCKTCKPLFYLYNSSSPTCVEDCTSVGLYNDLSATVCTGCKTPCVTCINTSTTCLTCPPTMIYHQNYCYTSCPTGYYTQSGTCKACPSSCNTCTSMNICQSCKYSFYLLLNNCLSQCPQEYPVIASNGSCQKCSDPSCKNCTQNDYCQQCLQPYYLHLGKCVQRCPSSYNQTLNSTSNFRECVYAPPVINQTNTTNTTNSTTQQAIVQTLSSSSGGNLFPVPFIIAAFFVGIATVMSKFQNSDTFVTGVLYSLWSLLEWAAVGLTIWFFYQSQGWQKIQFYLLAGAFAFLYLLNIIALLVQNIYLTGDTSFNKWLNMGSNRCFYYFVSVLSLFTTHKLKNLLFSKMFNFDFLKGRLDSVQNFRVFNAFSFLSFLSSGAVLFAMGLIFVTYTLKLDQTLMFYIDATVLSAVNIILAILNSRKSANFFQQTTQEGFIVHKRIQDFDQLLYGTTMPPSTQEKFDLNQVTGKKLISRYETNYNHLPSQISQESVRNISIQVDPILGEQSRITHLNDSRMSNLNLFQQKQVSIQFDQPPAQVQDKSIDMTIRQNNEVSIQMDDISHNQISVQVQRMNEQVSVQYAPNVIDQQIGMSREEAEISVQANPMLQEISMQANPVFEEISIQYSNKPVFVNIDHQYKSDDEDQLQESHQVEQSQDLPEHSRENQQLRGNDVTEMTDRIKKPDTLLKAQLELDIDERLRVQELEKRRLQEQKLKQVRAQAIADFQKKHFKPEPEDISSRNPKNSNKQINTIFNNEQTLQNDKSVLDSALDMMNQNQPKEFSSNQSRVQIKENHDNSFTKSIGGQKSQQEFIEMLSGKKLTTNSNEFEQDNVIGQNGDNVFRKNRILKVESSNQLQDSRQISLNMTEQIQPNEKIPIRNNPVMPNSKFKFSTKDQYIDSGSDQYQDSNINNVNKQISREFTKSISTKNMTAINRRPQNQKGIEKESLIDSSQDIEGSFTTNHDLALDIINAPIQPSMDNVRVSKNPRNPANQQSFQHHQRTTQLINSKARNLKSATLVRSTNMVRNGSGQQHQRREEKNYYDDSFSNQDNEPQLEEKQQPLPPPQTGLQNLDQSRWDQLEFGESEKVLISPLNTEELLSKQTQTLGLPKGVKKLSQSKNQSKNKSVQNTNRGHEIRASKSRQRPLQHELLNPSTSKSRTNIQKELQKQQKKVQKRKKNIQLMQGMLQRPKNLKGYEKQDQEERRRKSVQKIYLNRPNKMGSK